MPITKSCPCGAQFESPYINDPSRDKYCSRACAAKHGRPVRTVECKRCHMSFEFHGRGRCWYCSDCRLKVNVEKTTKHRVKVGTLKHSGAGSGGAQWGAENSQWKGGEDTWTKYRGNYRLRCFRIWERFCVVCRSTDRLQAHHIDGTTDNYNQENLVPLCHSCHWKVHWKRKQNAEELAESLFRIWTDGRIKIAEKFWNPATGIRGEGQESSPAQPQRLPDEPA